MDGIQGKSYLVTGGFSLVGSHIAEQLLEAGAARVVLLDNGSVGSAATVGALAADPRVTLVNADILRLDAVMEALEGIDGVFHTAFFITVPLARNLWTGMDVNVRGLMNVLEACRWQKVPRIVYSSSIAAYGHPSGPVVDESAGFQPAGMKPAAALYGAAKVMGEQLCAFYRERHGLDFAALRYATVYGERQHRRGMHVVAIMAAYEAARRGEAPVIEGDGTDEHDYVYAGDVARANLLAMQSDRSGEGYTIATGRSTPVAEVLRRVLDACNSPHRPRFTRVAADNPNAYQSVPRFDISKAERELGWKPLTSLDAGIRRLVAWCDAHPAP
jgi:UDP-glucose 4-epimerase